MKRLEPLLPGETRSEYLDRMERAERPLTIARKSNPDYPETLRLHRKFASHPKEPIGQTFTNVAKQLEMVRSRPSRRADLVKMLEAWKFWGEMDNSFQKELLDCIEYTYLKP